MKTALITGASSGIGYELAKLFAADGYALVLAAREEFKLAAVVHELEQRYHVPVLALANDLADPASPEELFKKVTKAKITIDALVNNAGFGTYGLFTETDMAVELSMIRVNVDALTHLTKLFLPQLVARRGKILNIASTAAFQPGPLMAVYYATKAYVLSFSEALSNEMKGTGVTVTTLCPGPTRTGFQKKAKIENTPLVKSRGVMEAGEVARIGYTAMQSGKRLVIAGTRNNLFAFLVRLLPRGVVLRMIRRLQEEQ